MPPAGSLPAAAERLDEVYAGGELQGIEIERFQLSLQEGGLRGNHGEIVGCALLVERHGEVQRTLCGVDRGLFINGSVVKMIQ